jgi:hypothetical protein
MHIYTHIYILTFIHTNRHISYIDIYMKIGIENVSGMDFSGVVIKQMQQRTIDLKLPYIRYFEVIIYVYMYVYLL